MIIFTHHNKWSISIGCCLLFLIFTGSAQAFVGSSFGSSNLQVNNGENLIWGNISDTSNGSASFVLFQEVTGGTTYKDRFRVDHSGNVYVGGKLCFGSYDSHNCSDTWGVSSLPTGSINQTLRYNGTGWEASNILINNNTNIGINTNSPAYRLDVNGQMRLQPSSPPTPVKGVIYFDGTANKFRCSEDGVSFVDCIGSGGTPAALPTGAINQTLRHDGTTWVASNLLYNNNTNIGIGTTAPSQKLDVVGNIKLSGDLYVADNKSIRVDNAAANTTILIGNYGDGGSFAYGTGPKVDLSVEGDIAGDRLCIETDCRDSWPSGLSGAGTANYVAKFTDATTLGNSQIFDNGTNVGIGVAAPTSKLEIDGNLTFHEAPGIDRYINPNTPILGPGINLFISAGRSSIGKGGNLNLIGGEGMVGDGGDVLITAGAGNIVTVSGNGGNVKINPGEKDGDGVDGNIYINDLRGNAYMGRALSGFSLTVLGNESITGRLGINTSNPAYRLDVNGQMRLQPSSPPTPVKGVIYFDSNVNKFKCSEDGVSFVDCISTGGSSLPTGAINQTLRHNGTTWVASNLLYNNNTNIGIGTTAPSQKLDVAGSIKLSEDIYAVDSKSIRVDATRNTNLYVGNYSDGSGFGYNTTYKTNLSVEGDIAGDRLCIETDCRDSWSAISNLPSGSTNETLRYNGTSWEASGLLINNNTNIGIGVASPLAKLDVSDNIYTRGREVDVGYESDGNRMRIYRWSSTDATYPAWAQIGNTANGSTNYGGYIRFEPNNNTITVYPPMGNNGMTDFYGAIKVRGGSPGANKILTSDDVGLAAWKTASELGLAGGLTGSGNTNYVAKFTGAGALGNSQIVDNGTSVGIGTASPPSGVKLAVNSNNQGGIYADTTNGTAISGTAQGTGASSVSVGVYGSISPGSVGTSAAGFFSGRLVTDKLCLGSYLNTTDCVTSFSELGLPTGATNQTLRYNGTTWVGNSVLINDGSKIGIGASPSLSATTNIRSANILIPALMLTNSSYDIVWGTNETLRLGEWDGATFTERLAILDDGRLGIGVATPAEALK